MAHYLSIGGCKRQHMEYDRGDEMTNDELWENAQSRKPIISCRYCRKQMGTATAECEDCEKIVYMSYEPMSMKRGGF
jgi:hypothetical protein